MSRAPTTLALLVCMLGLIVCVPAAWAQSADLALRLQLVPDEPLDAGDQADLIFTVENLGPDASGPIRVQGAPIIVVSGFNGRVLFRLMPAASNPCSLFYFSFADPPPGGRQSSTPYVQLASIPSGQSASCRLRIEVADPLERASVMSFRVVRLIGSAEDPDLRNNEVSFAVGSDAPRVIPAGGPLALTLLGVLLGTLGARSVRRRCGAGR